MDYKHYCVIDNIGAYQDFVLVYIIPGENGEKQEEIQYYTLKPGERLVEVSPPMIRQHTEAEGFVKPIWNTESLTWEEGLSEQELIAWEEDNLTLKENTQTSSVIEQQLAAMTMKQAEQDARLLELQQINAMLLLQQAQAGGEASV